MNILIVVDKNKSAIDRLAQSVARHANHHNIIVLPVHPKRPDLEVLQKLKSCMQWADIIDVHYWKSGDILAQTYPELFKLKPKILFHMNPYDADIRNWSEEYDLVVVGNTEIQNRVPYTHLVPYGIDLQKFKFQENYTEEKIVNMVVGRIEGKKGVLEVATACKELGYHLRLVGRVSKPDYMNEVLHAGGEYLTFLEDASEKELVEEYYKAAIHVCNSVDNFESGTLPILEAMLCGVPVLTRHVGHVPDLDNGENMIVRKGNQDDLEDLKTELKNLMENRDLRIKLREKGWNTARTRDERIMVRQICNLYNKLYLKEEKLVSIIIPTKDRQLDSLPDCLTHAADQSHKKIEIVIADSSENALPDKVVEKMRQKLNVPIKYIYFKNNGYSLAEARNRAVVEAEGDVLVFCDDRIAMGTEAVKEFLMHLHAPKVWVWGMKDSTMKGFIENFSAINRRDFISQGMFCERINVYGGMSQELRTRFERGGFGFSFVEKAKANSIKRSKGMSSRREDVIQAKYLVYKLHADI